MKERKKLAWLGGLLVVAGLVWYLNRTKPSGTSASSPFTQNFQLLAVENPQLHWQKLESAQKSEYRSNGRNIFSQVAPPSRADVKKAAALQKKQQEQPPPPVVIPPPELPAKFFGYGTVPNGSARRAFLSNGDDVFVVSEGETFLGRFRILKIGNASLEFEEISSGRRNSAPLDESGGTGPQA